MSLRANLAPPLLQFLIRDLGPAQFSFLGVDTQLSGCIAIDLDISLWQLTFASLFKAGLITTSLKNHWPLVTPELEDLYPSLRGFSPRFDYS
ncbi:MAG TPA: hypothetical protein VMR62_12100 [Bryobacteraceae bacterium]|nr:hypothetical protein [Bryobacteraceae bacterium]